MAKPNPWRRHDGDGQVPVEITDLHRRIQWRIIGTHRTKVVRARKHDWGLTFEWRYVQ
ncbi:MAG: hypothetical protein ACJ75S_06835 [Solirubrobacterales bacterium]|jgi:hypothetical protein